MVAITGRTLRDIRDAQRAHARTVEKDDPDLAKMLNGWADQLDAVIAAGKELLG